MLKKVESSKAPKAVGPYSQAIVANGFVFCSGQIAIDPKTNEMVVGLENQTHQVLKNLQAVLKSAKTDFAHVVRCDIFVASMSDYAKVNEIYGSYFKTDPQPARQTVEVSCLPKNALIEISCIASIS